jgi:hypothetical protein
MTCPVCLSRDATVRDEPLQMHVNCRYCGGAFILTSEAAREVTDLTGTERDEVSACLSKEREARVFTAAFIRCCLE